jgi:hypothetical protein
MDAGVDCPELLGLAETAAVLGMTKRNLLRRRARPDFPAPIAELAATPVWTRADVLRYAKAREERFVERAEIAALAQEPVRTIGRHEEAPGRAARLLSVAAPPSTSTLPEGALTPEEAARELGRPVEWIRQKALGGRVEDPLPVHWLSLREVVFCITREQMPIWRQAARREQLAGLVEQRLRVVETP